MIGDSHSMAADIAQEEAEEFGWALSDYDAALDAEAIGTDAPDSLPTKGAPAPQSVTPIVG